MFEGYNTRMDTLNQDLQRRDAGIWNTVKRDPSMMAILMGLNMMNNSQSPAGQGAPSLGKIVGQSGLQTFGQMGEMAQAEREAENARMQAENERAKYEMEQRFKAAELGLKQRMEENDIGQYNDKLGVFVNKLGKVTRPNDIGIQLPQPTEQSTPQPKFTDVNTLGGRFEKASNEYFSSASQMSALLESAKQQSSAGDLAMIFQFMKVLDPASTVREGEFAQAGSVGGLPEKIQNLWNAWSKGHRLSQQQRREIIETSFGMLKARLEAQKEREAVYSELARAYGMNPALIIYNQYANLPNEVTKYLDSMIVPSSSSGFPTVAGKPNGGETKQKNYIFKDGNWVEVQ